MNSLKSYTCDTYEYINEYLRENTSGDTFYDKCIEDIDSMLTLSDREYTVYRGITSYPIFGVQKSYISTTHSIDVARMHGTYLLCITVPMNIRCRDLCDISYIADEEELLIGRGYDLVCDDMKDGIFYCHI
jgi:hypothetical protein